MPIHQTGKLLFQLLFVLSSMPAGWLLLELTEKLLIRIGWAGRVDNQPDLPSIHKGLAAAAVCYIGAYCWYFF